MIQAIRSSPGCDHHPRRSRKRPAGFTLIELVAIIVLVGIMAGVALPSLSNLAGTRSGAAGKQLLRDLTFAQQRALTTGTVSWVVFNTGAGTWSILAENPASPGRAGATVITDMATGKPFVTTVGVNEYVGVSMTACNFDGATEVGFNWLGKPLNSTGAALAAQGSVTLSAGNRVTVEAVTGCIRYVP